MSFVRVIIGLVLPAIMLLTACSSSPVVEQKLDVPNSDEPSIAVTLPSFNMEDMNGNHINLSSLTGKKVFVNLWASWCPPCRNEMPSIQNLYQSVNSEKAVFVMLSLDESFEPAKQYINSGKFKMPFYYPAETLPALFNVPGIPATFIFNEAGILIKRVDGGADYNSEEYKNLLN